MNTFCSRRSQCRQMSHGWFVFECRFVLFTVLCLLDTMFVQMFPGKLFHSLCPQCSSAAVDQWSCFRVNTESFFFSQNQSSRLLPVLRYALHLSRDSLTHFITFSYPPLNSPAVWEHLSHSSLCRYPVIWKQERKINMSLSDRGECQECWFRRCCCLFTCYCLSAAWPPTTTTPSPAAFTSINFPGNCFHNGTCGYI